MICASLRHRAFASVPLMVATLLLSGAGCEASISSVCDAYCDCQGCTDTEYDACVSDNEEEYGVAKEKGCIAQADAYVSCMDSELRCVEDKVEVSGCDRQLQQLSTCAGVVIGFGGCELGLRKLAECMGIEPDQVGECTPDTECSLRCIAAATCEEINMGGSNELNACINACPPVNGGGGSTGSGGSTGAGGAGGGPPPTPDPPPPGKP